MCFKTDTEKLIAQKIVAETQTLESTPWYQDSERLPTAAEERHERAAGALAALGWVGHGFGLDVQIAPKSARFRHAFSSATFRAALTREITLIDRIYQFGDTTHLVNKPLAEHTMFGRYRALKELLAAC